MSVEFAVTSLAAAAVARNSSDSPLVVEEGNFEVVEDKAGHRPAWEVSARSPDPSLDEVVADHILGIAIVALVGSMGNGSTEASAGMILELVDPFVVGQVPMPITNLLAVAA